MSWIQPSGALGIFAILVLTSLLACGMVTALARPVEARCGSMALNLKLDQTNLTARVQSSDGAVTFTGRAWVDRLPNERVVVTLNASIDTGWRTEIDNSTLVLTSTVRCYFCVSVSVPRGTFSNVTGKLVLSGRLDANGYYSLAETKGFVGVEPYYDIVLETPRPILNIPLWGSGTIQLTLQNRGNSNDSFSLAVVKGQGLADRGWTIEPAVARFDGLLPGENRSWKATITAGSGLDIPRSGAHNVNVTLTSMNASLSNRTVARSLVFSAYPEMSPASCIRVLEASRPQGSDNPGNVLVALLAAAVLMTLLRRRRHEPD